MLSLKTTLADSAGEATTTSQGFFFFNINYTLWANLADVKWMIFAFSWRKYIFWHFIQIVSSEDNLHGMPEPTFWEKNTKTISSAEILTQRTKR